MINPYQLFPPLTPKRYGSLKNSIQEVGVLVRIVCDEEGNIVDGFHRHDICGELGIHCPSETKRFANEAEKFEFALRANCERRQLNRIQREQLVEAYIKCDPELSANALALTTGISDKTITKIRLRLESTSEIPKLSKFRGLDGKRRRRSHTTIIADTPKQSADAVQHINLLPDNGKTLDHVSAKRYAKRQQQKSKREHKATLVPPVQNDHLQLFHCPFQQLESMAAIEPGNVDLVLTDFPYEKAFLPQLTELAEFSARVLKEGGLFVSYSGKYYLDKVLHDLGQHLTYRWMCSAGWCGEGSLTACLDLVGKWKPVLVYSKGPWVKRPTWTDTSNVASKEKEWHPWQQPLEEVEFWLRQFSEPGNLVVDPCGGGFTTAVACFRNNRRFIGCDIDASCVERGHQRLAGEVSKIEGGE